MARYENRLPFGEKSAGRVSLAVPRLVTRAASARAATGTKTPAALSTWSTFSRAITIAVLTTLAWSRYGVSTVLLVFTGGLTPRGLNQGNAGDDRASASQDGLRPLKGLQGFHSLPKRRQPVRQVSQGCLRVTGGNGP